MKRHFTKSTFILLLSMLACLNLFAQQHISGVVINQETRDPLVGVTVTAKGSNRSTLTNEKGKFSMQVSGNETVLKFTHAGFISHELNIGTQSNFKVSMVPDNKKLNEVVVIGYGTMKRSNLTGAITSIGSKDIVLNPSSNPIIALQGKVPGLDITKSSGKAGAGVLMQLRGTRSLSASGNPLILIDGMPGSYSTINPNDIKSIEVLKDAASTAIYGASGANGVILITTKSGKEGKTEINFDSYVGLNGWSQTPDVHMGDEYFNIKKLAQQQAGTYTTDEEVLSPEAYAAYQRGETIDWPKAIMSNNLTQNYSLSLSGGSRKTKAYFSLNYNNEHGQYKGDDYKVLSSNIRVEHKVNNWLAGGLNAQTAYTMSNTTYSKMENALRAVPYGRLYDDNGNLNVLPVAGDEKTVNYLLDTDKDVYRNGGNNYNIYFNPYIRLTPMKGLSFESRVSGHLSYSRDNSFIGIGSYQYYWAEGAAATGTTPTVSASITQNRYYSYKWENILTYKFSLATDHDFTFTGVTSYDNGQSENTYMYNNQFSSNSYIWENMGVGTSPAVSSSYSMSKGLGLIGRINYAYKGKYLFQASVREDGSSRLAEGHKWSTFPAASIGWRISDESFMNETKGWLSNLKLRIGYGVTGTASIDPYSSVSNIEAGYYSLSGEKVVRYNYSRLLANPDLTWEKSYNTNVGVDADFLNNRISFTADYYITNTDGVIWTKNLPVVNGGYNASTLYQTRLNICKTRNKGIELALDSRNIVSSDFTWNSTFTFARNKEEITKLAEKSTTPVINGDYALLVGNPVNSYYNYKLQGVWQNGEEAEAAVFGEKPGDLKIDVPNLVKEGKNQYSKLDANGNPVVDANGNKVIYSADNPYAISENDRQIIGHNSPDWSLGFQNTFAYKNFDLTIYSYMRFGQMINYPMLTDYDPTGDGNFPRYFNYWTSTNPSNDFPGLNASLRAQDYLGFYALSYVDGSFFKIKNITLGYTLPNRMGKSVGITSFRLYGTITNPIVVAKSHLIKQYDPEQNGSLDFPLTKQVVMGLNLTF